MPPLPTTQHSLIARLSEPSDAAAWSEFLQLYAEAIWRYSRSWGLQDADAADVVQQVLLLVHQKIGQWKPSGRPGAFRCWLLRVAHCICLNSIRTAGRADRAAGGTSINESLSHLVDESVVRDEHVEWQHWALCWAMGIVEQETDPVVWSAFVMNALDGVDAAEVARRLGLNTGNVYLAKCRILARLRTVVRELS